MNPFLQIGRMTFGSYTLFTNLGTVLGLFAVYYILDDKKFKLKDILKVVAIIVASMLVGIPAAKLVRNAFSDNHFGVATHFVGRVLVLTIVVLCVTGRIWKDKKMQTDVMNAAALYICVQHFFNRIACYMNGCCATKPDSPIAVPRQLFECTIMAILFVLLLYWMKKQKNGFYVVGIGFGLGVFLSEFLAEESLRLLGMTSVQYAALVLLMLLSFFGGRAFYLDKKH